MLESNDGALTSQLQMGLVVRRTDEINSGDDSQLNRRRLVPAYSATNY